MKNAFSLLITSAVLLISGCAATGQILPAKDSVSGFDGAVYGGQTVEINKATAGSTEYRIFNQGATGFVSVEANRADAEDRATQFCKGSGKQYRLLRQTTSVPPHILGNFPRAELVFECIEIDKKV